MAKYTHFDKEIERLFEEGVLKKNMLVNPHVSLKPGDWLLTGSGFKPEKKIEPMETLGVTDIIYRLIGHRRYEVKTYLEEWKDVGIFHVSVRMLDGQIVRFEESPDKFPSALLIDKLRLLQ